MADKKLLNQIMSADSLDDVKAALKGSSDLNPERVWEKIKNIVLAMPKNA